LLTHCFMSSLMTLPSFITNLTRCSSVLSVRGSPETAIKSANFPLSIDPTQDCHPMRLIAYSGPMESYLCEEIHQIKSRARNIAIRFSRNGSLTTLLSLLITMVA